MSANNVNPSITAEIASQELEAWKQAKPLLPNENVKFTFHMLLYQALAGIQEQIKRVVRDYAWANLPTGKKSISVGSVTAQFTKPSGKYDYENGIKTWIEDQKRLYDEILRDEKVPDANTTEERERQLALLENIDQVLKAFTVPAHIEYGEKLSAALGIPKTSIPYTEGIGDDKFEIKVK